MWQLYHCISAVDQPAGATNEWTPRLAARSVEDKTISANAGSVSSHPTCGVALIARWRCVSVLFGFWHTFGEAVEQQQLPGRVCLADRTQCQRPAGNHTLDLHPCQSLRQLSTRPKFPVAHRSAHSALNPSELRSCSAMTSKRGDQIAPGDSNVGFTPSGCAVIHFPRDVRPYRDLDSA
jgi:hypothetical protein